MNLKTNKQIVVKKSVVADEPVSQPQEPETELKPCPFCGGKGILSFETQGYSFVVCEGCGCMTQKVWVDRTYSSDEKAKEAWNRRV